MAVLDWFKGNALALAAILVSLAAFTLTLYRDVLLRADVRYSVVALNEYPGAGAGSGLSIAVTRGEVGTPVPLKDGVKVALRSVGWATASEVELRVRAEPGTVIVQVHTDDRRLVERLPEIGRQGSPEVFVSIRRMVPGEGATFTFWYGYPGGSDTKRPPQPAVLVRHAEALGRVESAK